MNQFGKEAKNNISMEISSDIQMVAVEEDGAVLNTEIIAAYNKYSKRAEGKTSYVHFRKRLITL